ncbi:MAG: purine-nucleoside phosphorylase [Christensenellales bacterium]|jgi:purine-nucleoside phosphorylase
MANIPTPHIGCADPALIAPTVLMPGDPLRAKFIAENYLKDPVLFNETRGMLGYTGTFEGKRVSVMGSGMGMPSAMIYYNELFDFYGVSCIIRVGTAGALRPEVKVRDVVVAMAACTTSGVNRTRFFGYDYAPIADFSLVRKAVEIAEEMGIPTHVGNVLSSDEFYGHDEGLAQRYAEYGVLAVEMETAGLYTLAAKYNKRALAICTISDSLVTGEETTAAERQSSFHAMMELALKTAP